MARMIGGVRVRMIGGVRVRMMGGMSGEDGWRREGGRGDNSRRGSQHLTYSM